MMTLCRVCSSPWGWGRGWREEGGDADEGTPSPSLESLPLHSLPSSSSSYTDTKPRNPAAGLQEKDPRELLTYPASSAPSPPLPSKASPPPVFPCLLPESAPSGPAPFHVRTCKGAQILVRSARWGGAHTVCAAQSRASLDVLHLFLPGPDGRGSASGLRGSGCSSCGAWGTCGAWKGGACWPPLTCHRSRSSATSEVSVRCLGFWMRSVYALLLLIGI